MQPVSLKPLLKSETPVLSIQNGLGGPDTAASILGKDRVMVGVVGGFGASMRAPGHAHHNGWELVRLGEFGGPITPRLKKVEDVWRGAGFRVKVFDDIDQLVWEKLLCNCAYSGPCAIAECTIGGVMNDPDLSRVSAACATEGFEVARKKNIKLGFDDPVAYVRDFGSKIPNARPSVLLDLMAGEKLGNRRDQRLDPAHREGSRARGAGQRHPHRPGARQGKAARLPLSGALRRRGPVTKPVKNRPHPPARRPQ